MQGVWREIAYYGRVLKELVFPRRCIVCGYGIETGYVCEQCRRNYLLQRVLKGEPREEYLAGQAEPVALDVLDSVLLLYKYDGVLKDALHRCKFAAEADLLPFLREEAEAGLPSAKLRWLEQFDIITCVPTSPERLAQRGFDVPQELFGPLLDQRSASSIYSDAVLERVRHTHPLFELGPEERRQELVGCFALRARFDVRGKHVLLCDDIYTTGSTLCEAAQVLKRAGAAKVSALAFCAARSHWE